MDIPTLAFAFAGLTSTFILFGVLFKETHRLAEITTRELSLYTWAFRCSALGFLLMPVTAGRHLVVNYSTLLQYQKMVCIVVLISGIGLLIVALGIWRSDKIIRMARQRALAEQLQQETISKVSVLEFAWEIDGRIAGTTFGC